MLTFKRTIIETLLLACGLNAASALTPQEKIFAEADHILTYNVLPTGGIEWFSDRQTLKPYLSNLAADALLVSGRSQDIEAVRNWMDWYIAHLETDGTVYDYDLSTGIEVSKGCYDSADAYAATYLDLIWRYYVGTGDSAWFGESGRKEDILLILGVMISLQESDGLTWAKETYEIKYLEDNCEVWGGFTAAAQIMETIYLDDVTALDCEMRASRVVDGLQGYYINGKYSPYKNSAGTFARFVDGQWYSSGQCQIWPQLWRVPIGDAAREESAFVAAYGTYPDENLPSVRYAELLWSAALLDRPELDSLMNEADGYIAAPERVWQWTCATSAFYIFANQAIIDRETSSVESELWMIE